MLLIYMPVKSDGAHQHTGNITLSSANLILILRFRFETAFFGPCDLGGSLQQ